MDTRHNGTERGHGATVLGPSQRAPLLTHEPRSYMAVANQRDSRAGGSPKNAARSSELDPETVAPALSCERESSIEAGSSRVPPHDPYQLSSGIVPKEGLARLRLRKRGHSLASHHRRQNELIESMLKPMEARTEDAHAEEEAARLSVKIAVYASLYANFVLCNIQLYAAISSASLSLLATAVDAVFDIGANVLLFWLHRKVVQLDTNEWPVGGARLETIGNVIYGFLMATVNLVVVVESITIIVQKENGELGKFHLPSIIAVAVALAVKFFLFMYSFSIRKHSSQVQVLWEDHRNDLYINSFGILMSCGGSKLRWWLDPVGALIIAMGIIISWTRTIRTEFGYLAGKSAPHDFLQLIIYKVATFHEDITKVDTVRAYHSGPVSADSPSIVRALDTVVCSRNYFVEVDIVMDGNTPLWKAHDLSQQLQDKIEVLPNVERAFVHVDYETSHYPVRYFPSPFASPAEGYSGTSETYPNLRYRRQAIPRLPAIGIHRVFFTKSLF
ncbi:hypothetical protein FA13DRAFT_1769908 [Coprinellus micaceus]|uniref:Uncharacterized protein n=1 Tax=Coprinellus micaceus TaxID=71717 RepID=A0A4Y7TXK6_COPMI|nr:hypothetical protein FA13DRAFT_1769908 [Coprinellus micaceus]